MNSALPPGDCGDRIVVAGWTSGHREPLYGACGLVDGTEATACRPDKERPPRRNPGGRKRNARRLSFHGVAALAVVGLGRCHGQPHLLSDCSREEAAQRMRLPAGRFDQLLRCGAAWSFEQVQNLGRLAALAGTFTLRRLGFLGRFSALLRGGGLLPRRVLRGRNVGATWRNTGLFRRCRLRGRGRFLFFRFYRRHGGFSSAVDHRGHDIHHSGWHQKQGNSAGMWRWRRNRDGNWVTCMVLVRGTRGAESEA